MRLEDYKKGLHELTTEELTEHLRQIRTSRTIPKRSNVERKAKMERKVKNGKAAPTKNQMLNLINGLSDADMLKLLEQMEDSTGE